MNIESWMIDKLNLSGLRLLIYAYLYSNNVRRFDFLVRLTNIEIDDIKYHLKEMERENLISIGNLDDINSVLVIEHGFKSEGISELNKKINIIKDGIEAKNLDYALYMSLHFNVRKYYFNCQFDEKEIKIINSVYLELSKKFEDYEQYFIKAFDYSVDKMPNIAPFRIKKYLNAAIENNFCIVIQNDKYNKFVPLNYEQRLKEIANETFDDTYKDKFLKILEYNKQMANSDIFKKYPF